MRLTTSLVCLTLLLAGCSRKEENDRPALERAQEKLEASIEAAEEKLAKGTEQAKEAWAAAVKRWEEMEPEIEQAIASFEERIDKLLDDPEALKRLPPEMLERVRARIAALREKMAEAEAAHERGNTDLAVEKADEVQRERAAIEEMLVERPDPP